MATIKGKTEEVLGKLNDIQSGDKVIITDNLYKITDIESLSTKTSLKIKLEKTSSVTVFEHTAAKLIAVLGSVESYTGPVTATPATTADEINTLAGLTTGVVTGTITSGPVDSALVASLTNVKTTDKISFTSNGIAADATDIVAVKAKLPLANFSSILTITGTSDDIAALKSAANIVKTAAVKITTGEISAADANALAKSTSGIVEAAVTAGTAAALNKALVDAKGTDKLTLKVTGKSATAADLKALNSKTLEDVDASSIETITGNANDVKAVLKAVTDSEITLGTPDITVSGTISAGDANTIASHLSAGVVTAKVEPGTANSLKIALAGASATDKLSLTVINNSDGSATSAADLVALVGKTASKIKVDAKALTGTEAQLIQIFVTNKDNFTGLGNKAVTITDAPATALGVNAILKATSGVVTANVTGDAADLKEALVDAKATDKLTLTISNTDTAASDLKALDAKTSGQVDASGISKLVGNAADVKAVLASTSVTKAAAGNVVIDVTGKVSAADVNTISKATTGIVTAAEVTAGTAAALNKALADVSKNNNDALTLTVTGTTAAASDLNDLNAKTSVEVDATAVKTITGSLPDLNAVYTAAAPAAAAADKIELNAVTNATVNGILTVADAAALRTLLGSVGGKVTATVTPLTADALVTALGTAGDGLIDALTLHVVEEKDAATGAITPTDAADLVTLDGKTSVKVKVDATQISGSYDNLESVYVTGKAGFSNLGNENVTITGTGLAANSAARVDSILKATTGIVTAEVTAASASDLVANLKNAKNDALDLTITATETKASDLKALDAKTSEVIDAELITKLVGNASDVKAVLVSNGVDLVVTATSTVDVDIDVTGAISAADANTIANGTNGIVTATVKADTAAKLSDALDGAILTGVDKINLTVTGASADAADLNSLNGMTVEAVNAAAIKTVTGTATDIETLYTAGAAQVSGLGNKAVSVTGEASAADITSINTATTGLINVASVNTALTANGAFALSTGLGNLSEITGLYNLSADDGFDTAITFSIADLLAANDSSKSFDFSIVGDGAAENDIVTITNTSRWTVANNNANLSQYVFTKGSQTITINLTDIDAATVI